MHSPKFISINGDYFQEDSRVLLASNRSFRYGDALFETMRASHGKVHFFYDHIQRLTAGMETMKMQVPVRFSVDTLGLQNEILRLLSKNKLFQAARIRLTVYRNGKGLYMPESDEINYLLETEKIAESAYSLNRKGLILGLYSDIQKSNHLLSTIKTSNMLPSILASLYCKENNLNDAIFLNTKGKVAEAISSNIFVVQKDGVYTPPITDGCLPGIMRKKVIHLIQERGWPIYVDQSIELEDINRATEIFLTNSIVGIRWVMGFGDRRYFNKLSKILIDDLNR